jgi:AraC family transcriptional regulator of adaptative response/methylated-DNA-[protein]-cysteine methyltransferase
LPFLRVPVAISYTFARWPIGLILIAASRRGICWLGIGNSERALLRELRSDLPYAELRRDDAGMRRYVKAVRDDLSGRQRARASLLDVRGTPFQTAVWRELRKIPRGETRSYAELARRIRRPRAVRAVGAAVGANPVSLLIPCHRAVGSDGSLAGFRWGIARKRRLLKAESGSI